MRQNIIVLYAGTYSVQDDKTGVINSGLTIVYYFNTSLDCIDNTNGTVGTRPAKCSVPVELMHKVVKAPALYDAEFTMNIGSDGKPVLKICDLSYLSPVVIQPVYNNPADEKADKPAASEKADKKAV